MCVIEQKTGDCHKVTDESNRPYSCGDKTGSRGRGSPGGCDIQWWYYNDRRWCFKYAAKQGLGSLQVRGTRVDV